MALKANYDFLFVGKDDNSYLENYSYDLYDKYGERSGEIFINLEIQNNPANSEEIGEAIFGTFQKEFFEKIEDEPYVRFERALKATNAVLNDFKSQKVSGYIGNLNIVIAAYVSGNLYVSQSGDAEAYLGRKKFVNVVTEGLYDEQSKDIFTNIASGTVESEDTVLVSSTRLLRYISKTDLGRILFGDDPAMALAEIKDVISTEMLGKIGLTVIMFKEVSEAVSVSPDEQGASSDGLFKASAKEEKIISTPRGGVRSKSKFSEVIYKIGGVAKGVLSGAIKKSRERRMLKRTRSPRDIRGSVSGVSAKISEFKKGLFRKGFGGSKMLIAAAAVLIVLIGGIWIVQDRRAQQAQIDSLDATLIDVQNKISEAETKGQYDKEAAGQILAKAQEDALMVLNSGQFRDKASILLKQIEETRDSLDNIKRVKDAKLVADLSKKRSTVNALGFVSLGDRLFVFEYNALYELVLDQVQDPVTLSDTETVIASTQFADRKSLVFLTKSGKLIEYKDGTLSLMDTEEGAFHKGVAIKDWSNRIYLLDPDNNQIWKYAYKASQSRFAAAAAYTAEGQFSMVKDFAIDSNVWVVSTEGIQKYFGGTKADLIISKMPFSALKEPIKILTSDKMSQIFVLDKDGNRVLVF